MSVKYLKRGDFVKTFPEFNDKLPALTKAGDFLLLNGFNDRHLEYNYTVKQFMSDNRPEAQA